MVLVEKIFYKTGELLADIVYYGTRPVVTLSALHIAVKNTDEIISGLSSLAKEHALKDKSIVGVTENLFECLEYLD